MNEQCNLNHEYANLPIHSHILKFSGSVLYGPQILVPLSVCKGFHCISYREFKYLFLDFAE